MSGPETSRLPAAVAVPARGGAPDRVQAVVAWITQVGVPRLSWYVGRTGRTGLVGLALLGASALFLFSTHLPMAGEVEQLRSDLQAAESRAATAPTPAAVRTPLQTVGHLPARTDMPAVLGILLHQAEAAQLSIETAKYEITATKAGAMVRYRISFPIDGRYPQIRQFIDTTLNEMPEVAIDDIAIARKTIADDNVEAQVRLTIFTRAGS